MHILTITQLNSNYIVTDYIKMGNLHTYKSNINAEMHQQVLEQHASTQIDRRQRIHISCV